MTNSLSRSEPGAGHPFLGFLNTVADDHKTRRENSFSNAAELVALLQEAGFPTPATAPDAAQMRRILGLREAAYGAFSAIAAGRGPGREDSLFLTDALRRTYAEARFGLGPDGLSVAAAPDGPLFDLLVLSMDDLMRSEEFGRLRECRRCTHLFIDKGRGVGRRWCSMSRCGNRAKAESFRARQRKAA